MFYIVFVGLLFMALVAVHVLYCRKKSKAGLHAKAFIFMAILCGAVYLMGVGAVRYSGILDPHSLWGEPFIMSAGIIFILLVPVYLCFYVLTQLTSPSKKILLTIAQRGELSRADIVACVQKEDFIRTRLNDLQASGCVAQMEGRYILTSEGQKIAVILQGMQFILGRNVGG